MSVNTAGTDRIARRYAKAFLTLAEESHADFATIQKYFNKALELFTYEESAKLLNSPVIPSAIKRDIIFTYLKEAASDNLFRQLIETVIAEGRITHMPGIIAAFHNLLNEKEGTVQVEVTTATKLSDADRQTLTDVLKKSVIKSKNINLVEVTDPKIIGGLIVKFKNSVVDLSLREKLDQMSRASVGIL